MMRTSIIMVLAAAALAGCKGETVTKNDPQVVQDLQSCKDSLAEKDKRIAALQDENAALMRGSGAGKEVTVVIEGNALTVKPPGAGETPPVDDKVAAAASKEFLNVVAKSRGAIQKCYEQALKKNAAPQGRTITLTVSASFSQAGSYRDASFAPSLGDAFDSCIKTVASKWALPQSSPAMTFKAQVSLTPS
jgi:ABC-type Fe3+-hydroxamate transport system substrate-binding protein